MRVEELVHELKEKITHLETELADIYKLIDLANKEIPKKIVYEVHCLNDRDFHIYKCPNCSSGLNCSSNDKYCGNCGQRLDWEE